MKDSPAEIQSFVEREIDYRPTCLMCQKNIAIPHKHIPWRP